MADSPENKDTSPDEKTPLTPTTESSGNSATSNTGSAAKSSSSSSLDKTSADSASVGSSSNSNKSDTSKSDTSSNFSADKTSTDKSHNSTQSSSVSNKSSAGNSSQSASGSSNSSSSSSTSKSADSSKPASGGNTSASSGTSKPASGSKPASTSNSTSTSSSAGTSGSSNTSKPASTSTSSSNSKAASTSASSSSGTSNSASASKPANTAASRTTGKRVPAHAPIKNSGRGGSSKSSAGTPSSSNSSSGSSSQASSKPVEAQPLTTLKPQKKYRRPLSPSMKAFIVVIVIIFLCCAGIFGFFYWRHSQKKASQQVTAAEIAALPNKPTDSNSTYGFLISKNGVNKPVPGVPTVQIYTDFICPWCGQFDRQLDPTFMKMIAAGQLNLNLHPCTFLDEASSDHYSTRTAAAAVYVAQNEPSKLLPFIEALFAANFQPQEGPNYQPVSDARIREQALKAGVSPAVAEKCTDGTYTEWIKLASKYILTMPQVKVPSGPNKGGVTTPTVIINGHYWMLEGSWNGENGPQAFTEAIGLPLSDVGVEGKIPSIGDSQGPIAPQKKDAATSKKDEKK